MAVGKVSDAAVKWMTKKWPKIGGEDDVVIPLVGECDDSWLNDAVGRHVRSEHVYRAIEQATGGKVAEGSVGAGTGLVTCDFKAGIGTSSRRVAIEGATYAVGILVQSNFGVMRSLRVDGAPVGEILEPLFGTPRREKNAGSIITHHRDRRAAAVVAAGAPVQAGGARHRPPRILRGPQLGRDHRRASRPRTPCPRQTTKMTATIDVLLDEACDPLYEAVVECTEEAIVNSLCMAEEMRGQSGHVAPALPLDRLTDILRKYRHAFSG